MSNTPVSAFEIVLAGASPHMRHTFSTPKKVSLTIRSRLSGREVLTLRLDGSKSQITLLYTAISGSPQEWLLELQEQPLAVSPSDFVGLEMKQKNR